MFSFAFILAPLQFKMNFALSKSDDHLKCNQSYFCDADSIFLNGSFIKL